MKKKRTLKKATKKQLKAEGEGGGIITTSNDKRVGTCGLELTKENLKKVLDLFKVIPSLESSMCFKVLGSDLIVFQNVESVMSMVILEQVVREPEDDFTFVLARKTLSELYDIMAESLVLKIKNGNLDIELGGAKLSLSTLEDVEIPSISIDLKGDMESSEEIEPDYLEGALNRSIMIKNGVIGILEGYVNLGDKIVVGGATFFTEVESKIKGLEVYTTPEFLPYIKNVARTATKWVKIYKGKDYIVVANDLGIIYKTLSLSVSFPTSIKELEKKGTRLCKFLLDRRSLATSLKKLSLVVEGVKEPILTLSTKKGFLTLEAKSLNNKISKDKIAITNLKGEMSKIKVNLKVLNTAVSVLDYNVLITVYEAFTVIEDPEQKTVFSNVE